MQLVKSQNLSKYTKLNQAVLETERMVLELNIEKGCLQINQTIEAINTKWNVQKETVAD